MFWRRGPTSQALPTLITHAVMLNNEGVMLREVGALDVYAGPGPRATISAAQTARSGSEHSHAALPQRLTVRLDIVGGEHKIEIALTLCQALANALLSLFRLGNRDQLQICIPNDNDTISPTPTASNPPPPDPQTQFLTKP